MKYLTIKNQFLTCYNYISMTSNKEEIKNKIIYRANYRGTKEMDILMSNFVDSVIDELNFEQLKNLDLLVNLSDEDLILVKKKLKNINIDAFILNKFEKFYSKNFIKFI